MNKKNRLLNRCISAIFVGVGGAVGSRILMFVANIIVSRILGREAYGQYSSVTSTVNLFVLFSGMGIASTLTHYIAASKDDDHQLGVYIGTLSRICVAFSALFSLALLLLSNQVSYLSTGTAALAHYFRIVSLAIFFSSMSSVEQSIMVGFEKFKNSAMVQLVRCGLFCVLNCFLPRKYGINGAIYALLIAHTVQYVISVIVNRRIYAEKHIKTMWKWDPSIKRITLIYAIPAFISGLCVMPVNWIGNAILTRKAGFSELAIFTVASQWMQYITYIPAQMGNMRPIYSDLYARKQNRSLRKLLLRISVSTTAVAAAVSVLVCFFSKYVLLTYGEEYANGAPTLILMVLTAILYTAQVQTGFILQAMKKMWLAVGINGAWGLILIGTLLITVSKGSFGYAVAYLIAYAVTTLLQIGLMIKFFANARDE